MKNNNAMKKYIRSKYRLFALALCLCMLLTGPYWPGAVKAADYPQISWWSPTTNGADNHELWDDSTRPVLHSSRAYAIWGKEITSDRDPNAMEHLFGSDGQPDTAAFESYLMDTYPYVLANNYYWDADRYYSQVSSWSYVSELSGTFGDNVRYAFMASTQHTFGLNYNPFGDNDLAGKDVRLYLYIDKPPEGIEGVTDWMPKETANGNDAWLDEGQEGKELTEARDSAALAVWDNENPDTAALVNWLNSNGYDKLIIKIGDDWSDETYDVTWEYSESRSWIDYVNETKYYVFAADVGSTVFYGADGAYEGKGKYSPLKFYLYLTAHYVEPPVTRTRAMFWYLYDANGDRVEDIDGKNDENLRRGVTSVSVTDWAAFADGVDPSEYVGELYKKYAEIGVTTDWVSNEQPYGEYRNPIKKIEYLRSEAGSDGRTALIYEITINDIYYWEYNGQTTGDDGNSIVHFYLRIYEGDIYGNVRQWRLYQKDNGYLNTSGEGITVVSYVAEVTDPEVYADELKEIYDRVRVTISGNWDDTAIYSHIKEIEYDEEKTAEYMQIINQGNIVRTVHAYKVTAYDIFYWASDILSGGKVDDNSSTVNFYIAVYEPTNFGNINDFLATPREPDGIVMNLFDYWPNTKEPSNEKGNPWPYQWGDWYDGEDFETGINKDHPLKFFYEGYSAESSYIYAGDGDPVKSDHLYRAQSVGLWNHGTEDRHENLKGIVKNKLVNGFPELNLNSTSTTDRYKQYKDSPATFLYGDKWKENREESLDYLFDPTVEHEGKASYSNVTGLLQMNQYGYYYYDSKLNFAEYDEITRQFLLYNTWGIEPGGDSPNGQFFPFNHREEVFSGVHVDETTGERSLVQFTKADNINSRDTETFNHFFGFTMEVAFQQPKNGQVDHGFTGQDMIFKFAGDDDVWIFVDDVLVLDLGGTHSGVYGDINFATGVVRTGLMAMDDNAAEDNIEGTEGAKMAERMPKEDGYVSAQWTSTTLRDMFEAAGAVGETAWRNSTGDTFADNTLHTIKLFYMERGHWDSNFAMYFNLQPEVRHRIYKVDEDGEPLRNATFELYEATTTGTFKANEDYHTASEFVIKSGREPLATLTTGRDGYALFPGGIDFADMADKGQRYYILKETGVPDGYKELRREIVLEYDSVKNVFKVLNQYELGVYASFSAIIEDNDPTLKYALLNVSQNTTDDDVAVDFRIDETTQIISEEHQKNALMFAVPMIYTDIGSGIQWYPIYGSNTVGYKIVDIYSPSEFFESDDNKNNYPSSDLNNPYSEGYQEAWRWTLRHNLLAAALRQAAYTSTAPDWYFQTELVANTVNGKTETKVRFTSMLRNLPGDADRYLIHRANGESDMNNADLRLVGLLVDDESLASLFKFDDPSITADVIHGWDDDTKYSRLQELLYKPIFNDDSYENNWDNRYNPAEGYYLPVVKRMLEAAYTAKGDSTRDQGVNLANINSFTRYYGSVIYIPNERHELRVLKQDANGNPLSGARFGLFDTFTKAALYDGTNSAYNPVTAGTTDSDGLLIFNINGRSTIPGTAYINWSTAIGSDSDKVFWVKEISPPTGYKLSEAIVQVYAGDVSIYANASAYRANVTYNDGIPSVTAELIDNIVGESDYDALQSGGLFNSDGVTVRATMGKLFQTMEKYADSMLNTTLLDVDTYDSLYIASDSIRDFWTPEAGYYGNWKRTSADTRHMHFWGDAVRYTSSDYSNDHQNAGEGFVFSTTENGYLFPTPVQTADAVFRELHAGERRTLNSRRDILYLKDGSPLDISGVFSPVNVIVMQDEPDVPGALSIGKLTTDRDDEKVFKFKVTLTAPAGGTLGGGYPYRPSGGVAETGAITWTRSANGTELVGEFELKHGQRVIIYNLPDGTTFTVEEIDPNGYTLQRIDTSSEDITVSDDAGTIVASGMIVEDDTMGVIFVNAPPLDLPSVGGTTPSIYYLLLALIIAFAFGCVIITETKNARSV